jgi:hypothetical protein
MILGMSLATFTQLHVALSLVGILTGLMVLAGLLRSRVGGGATATFLVTTILTTRPDSCSSREILPSHIVGIISLVALAIAVFAPLPPAAVVALGSIAPRSSRSISMSSFDRPAFKVLALRAIAPTQSTRVRRYAARRAGALRLARRAAARLFRPALA